MKNRKDIKQNTPEWFEVKWGKIGGTLSKGLFKGLNTLKIDILSQRNEEFEYEDSGYSSAAMDRGNDLEPFARDYLNDYTGLKLLETGWLQSNENELLGISPDGITECETKACEIKCFGRKKHMEVVLNNDIPLENIHQCLHYFTVNPKLKELHFIAFRPESKKPAFVKVLTLDSKINLGTASRPLIKSVECFRDRANEIANDLLKDIKSIESKINF